MKSITSLLCLGSLVLASPILKRDLTSDTQNQLVDGTACRDLTIIFARGTFESGNVGTYAGPQFFQAVAALTGESKLAVQGVEYAANVTGFFEGGDPAGGTKMADLVGQAQLQCPDTKVVMAGYSQGAQLVHNAAKQLNTTETNGVNSVVMFGDPDEGQAVGSIASSKVLTICHSGDDICTGGSTIVEAHLNYSANAAEAARFVVSMAGLS